MASSRSFEEFRTKNFSEENIEVKECYVNTPLPRFIWVCELFEKSDYPNKCLGEIVVDATSAPSAKVNSVIILHYPGMIYTTLPIQKKNYNIAHQVSCEHLESVNLSIARKIHRNEAEKDASREAAVRYRVK